MSLRIRTLSSATRRLPSRGFSLVELLTAMGVLAVMGLFLVQTVDITSRTVDRSQGSIDAASEGRLVLDRIGLDLAAMFIRKDMDYAFQNLSTTTYTDDILRFYSEVFTQHTTDSPAEVRLSLVGYRMVPETSGQADTTSGAGKLALFRGSRGISYRDNGFMGLAPIAGSDHFNVLPLWTVGTSLASNTEYDMISPGVFRMEIAFMDESGNLLATAPTSALHGGIATTDVSDIAFLIVGIAIVGQDDRRALNSAQIETMAAALPSVTVAAPTPFQAWAAFLDGTAFLPGPQDIVNQVRFFQRAYPIAAR